MGQNPLITIVGAHILLVLVIQVDFHFWPDLVK